MDLNRESPAALEQRLIAELAKQQHQSHEDQSWLQQEEINLVNRYKYICMYVCVCTYL